MRIRHPPDWGGLELRGWQSAQVGPLGPNRAARKASTVALHSRAQWGDESSPLAPNRIRRACIKAPNQNMLALWGQFGSSTASGTLQVMRYISVSGARSHVARSRSDLEPAALVKGSGAGQKRSRSWSPDCAKPERRNAQEFFLLYQLIQIRVGHTKRCRNDIFF